jgi:hypothetical protein
MGYFSLIFPTIDSIVCWSFPARTIEQLKRTMNKSSREKVKRRFARRQQRRVVQKVGFDLSKLMGT